MRQELPSKTNDVSLRPAAIAILCCIGPRDVTEDAVREACRLASASGSRWHAVIVEKTSRFRISSLTRLRSSRLLHLAAQLGANTDVLYESDTAEALIRYARDHALTTLVLSRRHRRSLIWTTEGLASQVATLAPDLYIEVASPDNLAPERSPVLDFLRRHAPWMEPLFAIFALFVLTLIERWSELGDTGLAMIMVLAVALVSLRGGRKAAAITTVANLLIYDFLVIPPRYSFELRDAPSVVTFFVMLVVGLLIGELTSRLRYQVGVASSRERNAHALSAFSRNLSGQMEQADVLGIGAHAVSSTFGATVRMLKVNESGELAAFTVADTERAGIDTGLAQRSLKEGRPCGLGTAIAPGSPWVMVPLRTSGRNLGVMCVKLNQNAVILPGQIHGIQTFGSLIALALERVQYIQMAREALFGIESERLRSSLLAALSHDLQTPLASVVGLADSMLLTKPALSDPQRQIAEAIIEEGQRMSASVANLLEMAKFESGAVSLRRDWHSLEEVIGGALATARRRLGARNRIVRLPNPIPLIEIDAALIGRVLVNLFDNSAKYTSADATLEVEVVAHPRSVTIMVTDDGPGLPPGREEALFAKFARGKAESTGGGVGLGLAICRAIVTAHGGTIHAEVGRSRGARFTIILPLTEAPCVLTETEIEHENV